MKKKQKRKKQPKTFKWYLDRILRVMVAVLIITGIILFISGGVNDNIPLMFVGIGMLPATGILITPNIVKYAFKDNLDWKSKFREKLDKLYKAGMLTRVSDMSPYQDKLLWGVRREALWNLLVLLLILGGALVVSFMFILNGSSENEGLEFLIIVAVITFGIPISAYNIASSAYRIRTVKRCEYNAYHTVAMGADGLNMWIMDEKENITTFDYCRCLGIRSKKIHNTKVILVFAPDEMYLLPDKE